MSTFPTATPSYAGFTGSHTLSADNHAAQHNAEQADIIALAGKLGVGASVASVGTILRGTGAGTSAWGQLDLTTDVLAFSSTALRNVLTDETGTGSAVFATAPVMSNPSITGGGSWTGSPTILTPTIASLVNAQHDHTNAQGGGQLGTNALQSNIVTGIKLGQAATCSLYKSADQTVSANTFVALTWNSELYDTVGLHDTVTNNSRMTVPSGYAGIWRVIAQITDQSATGSHHVAVYKNGSIYRLQRYDTSGSANGCPPNITELNLAVADFIEIFIFSGSTSVIGGAPPGQDNSQVQMTFIGTT